MCLVWTVKVCSVEKSLRKPKGFPGGSAGKESACNVGDPGLIPGLGRSPREGNGYLLQDSGLEYSTESKSPRGRKVSDTSEQLSLSHCVSVFLSQWHCFLINNKHIFHIRGFHCPSVL